MKLNKRAMSLVATGLACMISAPFVLTGCGGGGNTTNSTTNGAATNNAVTNGNVTNGAVTNNAVTNGVTTNTTNAGNTNNIANENVAEALPITPDQAMQIGHGDTAFMLTVLDENNNEAFYQVHTNKKTVGEALKELDIIHGDNGPYGMMVTTVNGLKVDPNDDGMYWAFYINDEYAPTGLEKTNIEAGNTYSLRLQHLT